MVPGVVILDYVLEAMREWKPKLKFIGMSQVKFVRPILPGQRFFIQLTQTKATNVRFSCYVGNDAAVQGFMGTQETK